MKKYLADTTVLVEHLRGNDQAKEFLQHCSPSISHVSIAELIAGTFKKQDLKHIENLLKGFEVAPVTETISSLALELMKQFFHSHHLEYLDALIAATAITFRLSLITENTKHFQMIKELSIIPWPPKP